MNPMTLQEECGRGEGKVGIGELGEGRTKSSESRSYLIRTSEVGERGRVCVCNRRKVVT